MPDCPVHDASWTGQSIAQPSMLLAALGPQLNQLQQQAHKRQAASPQTHFNHGITAAIYNTILYDFTAVINNVICRRRKNQQMTQV
jgi:hypothetical protein